VRGHCACVSVALAMALLLAACGTSSGPVGADADLPENTGPEVVDLRPLPDAGPDLPDVGPQPPDAGPELVDLVSELPDVGPELPDLPPEVCTPACDGIHCGEDGCGGWCESCDDNDPCTPVDSCQEALCVGGGEWPPGEAPAPLVLLALDTSTSMQYSITAQYEGELPVCHEQWQESFDYQKSRWVVLLEALTGTFNGYWCSYDDRMADPEAEDYGHAILHVVAQSSPEEGQAQQSDGILDLYGETIRFGLVTYDPKPSTGLDATGGFSYGEDRTWGGITTNLGAKNASAAWGAMVVPPVDESPAALADAVAQIHVQLLSSRPYAGSPMAPQLDDALHLFQGQPELGPVDPETGIGDPLYACRPRTVVVITDGQPNLGEGVNGYPDSNMAAASLLELGFTVHVVGLYLPMGDSPVLDQIAASGGTGSAHLADAETLKETLISIMDVLTAGQTP
jgi:hypothetical protein